MFKVGEKVFYPYHGIVTISEIIRKESDGEAQDYYVLHIPAEEMKVMIPVGKEKERGLRKPISRKETEKIFEFLEEKAREYHRRLDSTGVLEKLESSNIYDVADGVSILLSKREAKDLSWAERSLLKRGLRILSDEIATARGTSSNYVKRQITRIWSEKKVKKKVS